MGQPAHPHGTRVTNIQVADNTIAWNGRENAAYFQSYMLAVLFKFIRHWLRASLLLPHKNPWTHVRYSRMAKLRSRKAVLRVQPTFPVFQWENNLPKVLRKSTSGRIFDGIVIRYFRQLPPRLILRDSTENLIRPAVNIRRPRYSFTFWSRPKLLRYTNLLFCVLRGLGAGEKTPAPRRSRLWRSHVQKRGAWKKVSPINKTSLFPQRPYFHSEL